MTDAEARYRAQIEAAHHAVVAACEATGDPTPGAMAETLGRLAAGLSMMHPDPDDGRQAGVFMAKIVTSYFGARQTMLAGAERFIAETEAQGNG